MTLIFTLVYLSIQGGDILAIISYIKYIAYDDLEESKTHLKEVYN